MSANPVPKPLKEPRVAIELDRDLNHAVGSRPLVIRWGVSRRALGDLAPRGPSPLLHLELRIDQIRRSDWVLIDPRNQTHRAIDLPGASPSSHPLTITHSAAGMHIRSPGLCCDLRVDEQGALLPVYVRTDLFNRLNIPGGRYEPVSAEYIDR